MRCAILALLVFVTRLTTAIGSVWVASHQLSWQQLKATSRPHVYICSAIAGTYSLNWFVVFKVQMQVSIGTGQGSKWGFTYTNTPHHYFILFYCARRLNA